MHDSIGSTCHQVSVKVFYMNNRMRIIKKFLQLIACLHIVSGILLPFLVDTPVFTVYLQHFAHAFSLENKGTGAEIRFLVGLLGPTIASWGILFLFAINTGFSNPNPRTWWFIVIACIVWAPYDSWISLSHGVYLNAIFNCIVFVCIIVPLLVVRPIFFEK